MSAVAPNLFVSNFIPAGTAYVMDLDHLLLGLGRGLAMSVDDWERMSGAARERIVDALIKQSAEAGLSALQDWLAARA